MNYCVRVNGKVIEESISQTEIQRRARTTWLKAQAQGLRVEVAEAGTQNFRLLDQFLSSVSSAGNNTSHSLSPLPLQPPVSGGGQANSSPSTQRLTPTSFNNPTQTRLPASPSLASPPSQAFPPPVQTGSSVPAFPPPTPVSYQNYAPQSFPALSSGQWRVVAETNRLDPALHSYIRPEHYGHNGPWLVRGHDLVPRLLAFGFAMQRER